MPEEHGGQDILERTLLDEVVPALDVEAILRIASAAESLGAEAVTPASLPNGTGLKIGYFKDAAFSFYYAENLEAIERSGAELVAISPLAAAALPRPRPRVPLLENRPGKWPP